MSSFQTTTIQLSLTTDCSMRCKYCYSYHKPEYLTKEAFDNGFFEKVHKIMDIWGTSSYHVSLFGGEPTMNWDIIEYVVPKLREDPKCIWINLITNGSLIDDYKADFILNNNISTTLSFDGIWSKESRPLADGSDSFENYMSKMPLYEKIHANIKTMLAPRFFNTLAENFEFFVTQTPFKNPDFSLIRDDIYTKRYIETYEKELPRLTDKILELMYKGYRCTCGLHDLYLKDTLAGKRFGKRQHGCFAGHHGCVYTTKGELYPCERYSARKQFQLMDINGNPNLENIKKLQYYANPHNYEECKQCELREVCNAGCTWSEMQQNKFEGVSPLSSLCQIFKITYKEAFRLLKLAPNWYREYLDNHVRPGNMG